LVGDRAWSLISPLDLSVSDATLASRVDVADVVAQQLAQCDRDGGWFTHKLDYHHFPHVVMGFGDFVFTSIHLALRKEGSARPSPVGEWERAHRSVPLSGTHTVELGGEPFPGTGWSDPDDNATRWTGPGRDAYVDAPVLVSPGTTVELLVVAAATPAVLEGLRVEVNGLPVACGPTAGEDGTLLRGVVPASYGSARPFTRISLRTPALPHDARGVAVRRIRLTAPS
ncbi:MAG: hypothetical protein M3326_08945, partial [Actinomycetota bacterium]|nr:hypothetical protein [Actinomycetota bacterium]